MFRRVAQAFKRYRGRVVLAASLGLAGFAASYAAVEPTGLLQVRLGGDAAETRLVLDLDRSASARLIADGVADRRVVIALPGVTTPDSHQGAGRGLVKSWSLEAASGGARLAIDLAPGAALKRRFLLPPADGVAHYRYVIDVTARPGTVLTTADAPGVALQPPLRTQFISAPKRLQPLKRIVVVDAGHGGRDVGALGASGHEKDINLAAAQALRAKLEKTGRYKVVMTRNSDLYVPLETRVRIAQRANADLFISLHADSGPEPDVRGASVYTLSDKASQRAAKFVNRDDWFMKASLTGDQGVRDILFDLTQRATRNRSAVFAQTLLTSIEGKAPLLRRSHRDAGFMVLLAPDVPAVLLEMGFISNLEDERMLSDPARRDALMKAVADAIDTHFGETLKLAAR